MTILYEVHDICRFPGAGEFASYSRLVKCEHHSDGKRYGYGGKKIGNAHLSICIGQAKTHLDGAVFSVELASLGRRTAETELELLNLIE